MSDYDLPIGAHDRYLADYHRDTRTVWCSTVGCENHLDGAEVTTETEYGQTVWLPEECPRCHGEWLEDRPDDEEEN